MDREGTEHLGLTFEDRALFDLKDRRVDHAADNGRRLNFYPLSREDVAIKPAGDDDYVCFDLPGDIPLVADQEDVWRENLAFERSIDPCRPLELKSSL